MTNEDQNISYIDKSFTEFKGQLQQYAKTYFPNTYNDFSESTPGNMFIEMASYVGDVMSFYLDTQTQENFLLFAKEKENLYAQAYTMGYRPKASYASSTTVDVYQLCPIISGSNPLRPDITNYGLLIPANTVITSTSTGTKFITTQEIDFTNTASAELTFVNSGSYLIKKSVPAISAELKSTTISFAPNQKFATANITDTNILQILNVTGSDGNIFYEVPYLAQSTIFQKTANTGSNQDQVPYLLSLQRVPRRFVSRILSDNTIQLEFGAGISNKSDSQIIPELRYLPTNPDSYLRDRIIFRNQVFTPKQIFAKGIITDDYTLFSIDCNQVNAEEMINDPQFQQYANYSAFGARDAF